MDAEDIFGNIFEILNITFSEKQIYTINRLQYQKRKRALL